MVIIILRRTTLNTIGYLLIYIVYIQGCMDDIGADVGAYVIALYIYFCDYIICIKDIGFLFPKTNERLV